MPVTRKLGHHIRRKPLIAAVAVTAVAASAGVAFAQTNQLGFGQVGQTNSLGQIVASDQVINPIGQHLVINDGKIMGSTVSPDGSHLAASVADGPYALDIVNLSTHTVQQHIGHNSSADLQIPGNSVGQVAPSYSPDGKQLCLGQSNGNTKFTLNTDGTLSNPVAVNIPTQNGQQALVGAAVFSSDGSTVYSAVNGQNRVVAIDAATGNITQSWATGIAPRGMVLVGGKLYVSNEGGRLANSSDTTMNSYGTQVPANGQTGSSTTGTVSVINVAQPSAAVNSIDVGLHPTDVYAKGGAVFVTNTNSNSVSVIDASKDAVVQTITTEPWTAAKVGYEPDAVTLTDDGHLLVTLGRANAVAVYNYTSAQQPVSYLGLLPTDYFPAEVATVGNSVVVSNTRGIDARRSAGPGHGTHDTTSSVQWFTMPNDHAINGWTAKVFAQNGWNGNSLQLANGNPNVAPVPVPVKLGDPSTIKHVFLLVKENRTYDQVFGDMPQGNGDSAFTTFGANVTPNQHALASQFGLYDNFYDVGTNSAEGHNWLMQSDDPEYTESSAGEYTRSYDTENDVLGHQSSGFIWSGAEAAGKSVKDYGEFLSIENKPSGATWQKYYCDAKNMMATGEPSQYPIQVGSAIPSLDKIAVPGFPQFDLTVPDIYKEQVWAQDFAKNGPAALNMFWFSNDHTGGPISAAGAVADNDLAVGRMVDTISHSKYWKDSAIFVVEDDSQAGLDHVDGHRAPVQVISPWALHGATDNHYYSQITMMRTIEQILGIHPMNQLDTAATPMYGAFTNTPDYTPFNAVPNRTSLTLGLSGSNVPSCGADTPATSTANAAPAQKVAFVPASMQKVAAAWTAWQSKQRLTGKNAVEDFANNNQMNRFTWYQTTNWSKPYPGDSKVLTPNQVPLG
ncbi:MAG: phosphoesterase [Marmoricola sp.]